MSTNARFLPSDSGLYLPPYWSEGMGTPGGAAGAAGGRFPGAGSSTGAEATSLPQAGGRPLQRLKPAHPCPALPVAAQLHAVKAAPALKELTSRQHLSQA